MPELAEVHYFAHRWRPGLNRKILGVEAHAQSRVLRGQDGASLVRHLTGATLRTIETHGKQMRFVFSHQRQLGLHLGMTGALSLESSDFKSGPHDHLVLRQRQQSLVFRDPRMFGRILFHPGPEEAPWWSRRPVEILSPDFTLDLLQGIVQRHAKRPLKAMLLLQESFPGVGNWMADEILWRSRLGPQLTGRELSPAGVRRLWKETVWVSRQAMKIISPAYEDPPRHWLFPHRWKDGGHCPRCRTGLKRKEIGGRTTCWCPSCQEP